MLEHGPEDGRCELSSATTMPRASGFLWNRKMMIQVNCRGYVSAQHMQPEPGKYSYAPNLEAHSFMQPEQPYYAHHPGRFVYFKDEEDGACFSIPYEPVRKEADAFTFSVGTTGIQWSIRVDGLEIVLALALPADEAVELWTLKASNIGSTVRKLSIYPFFTVGYMSWMNQSAMYREDLGGIVASCVTPYQKVEQLERVRSLKDKTFLLHDTLPVAWETALEVFEGEGGLHHPSGIQQELLGGGDALYEMPAAALQYRIELNPGCDKEFRFIFGPARSDAEIGTLRKTYLGPGGFEKARTDYQSYMNAGRGCLTIRTPDPGFDQFVNHWLARQVYYHGDTNRLTTDPQTRNYLQDAMGMAYIQPAASRRAFLLALGQQKAGGAMPDGVLLNENAELKFINQVPHSDHCVWLPVCLQAYLDETGDYALLEAAVTSQDDDSTFSVFDRVTQAVRCLIRERDERGLNFIAQGDWCDPMNMVGHKGKGVSAWLSIATVHAMKCWASVCDETGHEELSVELKSCADEMALSVQQHFWSGDWFARGITDDNTVFGVSSDREGRIYLNPQSWAMLAGISSGEQRDRMICAVEQQLEGPYGVEILAPAYTALREDVGRLTQKYPGSAENGSVYNHAAAFYIAALFEQGQSDRAFRLLRRMIPGPGLKDLRQRGQLPVFIPNYYRGALRQFPRTAGRSSQLFNTGTVGWVYRIMIEQLFGVRGCRQGLKIDPQLPSDWNEVTVQRDFRGARFNLHYSRKPEGSGTTIVVDGVLLEGNVFSEFTAGMEYDVEVTLGGAAS